MLTEMAKGKTLEEAKKITNKSVAEALEGLPKNKLHCSNLGADALHQAIQNYEDKKAGIVRPTPKRPEEPLITTMVMKRERNVTAPIAISKSRKMTLFLWRMRQNAEKAIKESQQETT